jgi:4-hydroxy-3-methylbut-2-en-1-yl diphosphate synthase IspG/GcpE
MATKKNDASVDAKSEIRIGVADSSAELNIESELAADKVQALVHEALKSDTPLVLTDTRGKQTIIAAKKIAFVEVGESQVRKVGFAAN